MLVEASDTLGASDTQLISLSITNVNEAPTDIALSNNSLAERQLAGTLVGRLQTIDPDAGNSFQYAFINGAGDSDNFRFSIVGNNLISREVFDYESQADFSIRVRATDQAGLSTDRVLDVAVENVNEPPVSQNASAMVVVGESASGQLIADDIDSDDDGTTLLYSLVSNSSQGTATVFANGQFSFETGSDFPDLKKGESREVSFVYRTTDRHGLSSNSATVFITVDGRSDAPPLCRPSGADVAGHVFAVCEATLDSSQATVQFELDTSSYTLPRGYAILGFHVEPLEGSTLDPAVAQLTGDAPVSTVLQSADLSAYSGSLHLARVGLGNLVITVGGQAGSSGSFRIQVFLAGDVDGSRHIDAKDVSAIRTRLGSRLGQPLYTQAADTNLDGIISSFDYAQTSLGHGVIVIAPPENSPRMAAAGDVLPPVGQPPELLPAELERATAMAIQRWIGMGLNPSQLHRLELARVQVGDLPEDMLGLTFSTLITIDSNAAGYGWVVDTSLVAPSSTRRMDLIEVLMHELGHVLGYTHDDQQQFHFMSAELAALPLNQAFPIYAPVPAPVSERELELDSATTAERRTDISPAPLALRQRSQSRQGPTGPGGHEAARKSRAAHHDLFAQVDELLAVDVDEWLLQELTAQADRKRQV